MFKSDVHKLIVMHATQVALRERIEEEGYSYPNDEIDADTLDMLASRFTEALDYNPQAEESAVVTLQRKRGNKRISVGVKLLFDPLFAPRKASGFIRVAII